MDLAYTEEETPGGPRTVLKFHPALAPVKVAVFPLMKNKPELVARAQEVYKKLRQRWMCEFDDNGNVGKRYRRQDEIGTPYCVTIDFDTLNSEKDPALKDTVTVRDRDSMVQDRVKIVDLENYLAAKLGN
jgi:glycyl-tRNA synthetase